MLDPDQIIAGVLTPLKRSRYVRWGSTDNYLKWKSWEFDFWKHAMSVYVC